MSPLRPTPFTHRRDIGAPSRTRAPGARLAHLALRLGLTPALGLAVACSHAPTTPPEPTAQATAPARDKAPGSDCAQLLAQITETQQAAEAARERQAGAWKLVVPFAVLARAAQAGHELDAAEQRLATLRAQAGERGCAAAS